MLKKATQLRELSARSRAVLRVCGYSSEDLKKPRIGIANSWTELSPGHSHLRTLAKAVREGITDGGGTPFEFSSFAQCGAVAGFGGLENGGVRYDTPTRDIVAASVEACTHLHLLDGLVLLSSCDKNVPAHLLAAARLNVPSIMVLGGPMRTGWYHQKEVTVGDVDLETYRRGMGTSTMSEKDLEELEKAACPGPGACAILGTANTMQGLSEALGMTLPQMSSRIAGSPEQLELARESGRRVVQLVMDSTRPSDIFTRDSIENAIKVLHAMGGSTNAILHLLALCEELDLGDVIDLARIEKLGQEIPWILNVKPSGEFYMEAFAEAGGIPALMKRLESKLQLDVLTVNGKTLGQNLAVSHVKRPEVVHSMEDALSRNGLAVLRGNLADSAIARPMVIPKGKSYFRGPARVYDSQEAAVDGLRRRELKKGEVLVVRYEGARGGPGLTEVFKLSGYLQALGLDTECAFVTDGKMSGFGKSFYVVQVSPEAYIGGNLALVENGDTIEIDIFKKKLELLVSTKRLEERKSRWSPPKPRVTSGFLTLYARLANPPEKGAALNLKL